MYGRVGSDMSSQQGATTPLVRFEASLAELDVPVTRAEPAAFEDTLEEICRGSTVGTPLGFESVSLPGWVDDAPTPATLEAATTSVTPARFGVADYGSVALPSTRDGTEQVSLFVDLHVPVVRAGDVLPDMRTAMERLGPELRAGKSSILATGPSATADMGALVRGAHGPEEVHVVVLEGGADR